MVLVAWVMMVLFLPVVALVVASWDEVAVGGAGLWSVSRC
jgi:hypothetical protein